MKNYERKQDNISIDGSKISINCSYCSFRGVDHGAIPLINKVIHLQIPDLGAGKSAIQSSKSMMCW
jgi:hypothetical protein